MALEHSLQHVSTADDGLSVVIRDTTSGYGVEGNSFRSDLVWLVSVARHDGHAATASERPAFLRNTGTEEAPVYEPATALEGDHLAVRLPEAGRYEIKSALVRRLSTLSPTEGMLALNGLFADDETLALRRVTEVVPLEPTVTYDEAGDPLPAEASHRYEFEELSGYGAALEEGYPSAILPILQLLPFRQALALGNLSYLSKRGTTPCSPRTPRTGDYYEQGCGDDYLETRELCQDVHYQLMGAEANFHCGQDDKLYTNLRELGHLAALLSKR